MPCDAVHCNAGQAATDGAIRKAAVLLAALCAVLLFCPLTDGSADTRLNLDSYSFDVPDDLFPEAEDDAVYTETHAVKKTNQRTYFSGHYSFSASTYLFSQKNRHGKTGDQGINALKSSLFFRMDADLWDGFTTRVEGRGFYDAVYVLKGENRYTRQMIQENQSGMEVVNCYVDGRISEQMDIRIGRQVVVWGKSDTFRITDVLNPVDLSVPGRTSLDELRLPVFMAKLDYYTGPFTLSALMVPEKRWNIYPVFGSRFYPYAFPADQQNETIADFDNMDFGFSLAANFFQWDLSLYTAKYSDKTPHVKMPYFLPLPYLEHADLVMAGMAADVVWKDFIFKTEAAYTQGVRFSDHIDKSLNRISLSDSPYSKTDLLLGLEYSGFKNTWIFVDVTSSRINGYNRLLELEGVSENTFQASIKWMRSFANARTTVTAHTAWEQEKAQGGAIHRIKVTKEVSDRLSVSLGAVLYHSGKSSLTRDIGNNDMLFMDLIYYF